MSQKKPHNRLGMISSAIFFVTFTLWAGALWWAFSTSTSDLDPSMRSKEMDLIFWIDVVTFFPFFIGAALGYKAAIQKDTNPMFSFMGFALNGIMAFLFIYRTLGISW